MESLYKALVDLGVPMDLDAPTMTGQTWGERLAALDAPVSANLPEAQQIIRARPIREMSGTNVLRGNFFTSGVVKVAAMSDKQYRRFNGRVFVVAPDPWMVALDLESGRELWGTDNWAVRESIGISADGGRVFVRTTEGLIAAISATADDAEALWETDTGLGYDINSAMLVEKDGVVFYGTKNGILLALDAATGAIKWKHRVGVSLLNTVTPLSGREVVVTDFDGHVTLLSAER